MKTRAPLYISLILVAIVLLTGVCAAGFVAGRALNPQSSPALVDIPGLPGLIPQVSGNSGKNAGTPQNLESLFTPFWQAWKLVHEEYVDQPVDDTALMRGAIQGMLAALKDQHTSYLDPEMYQQSEENLNGTEYTGIGAWVDITGDYLTIISPMPDSPAEKAGLLSEDKIIAVDGEDMTGVDGKVALQKVLGPEGTTVRLTVQREGQEQPFDIEVTRAKIVAPLLESRMLANNIAYVRLFTFGDTTSKDLRAALEKLLAQNPKGLVLDLRGNGGGYLETAIDVASEFIATGPLMYEQYGDGKKDTFEARGGGVAYEIPMVVLINEGSASASEIVAGAIQDRGRGKLVGVTSFGKGSVQIYTPLPDGQGAVRITIARWLTPNGRTIHEVGLTPDVTVEITEQDIQAGRDPQLDKAVELLTQ